MALARFRNRAKKLSTFYLMLCAKAVTPVFSVRPPSLTNLEAIHGPPQDPASKRAADAEEARRRRSGAETRFLDTGQLALAYLRYVVAGETAGD